MLNPMRKRVQNLTPDLPRGTGLHAGGPAALASQQAAGEALVVPLPHLGLHVCDLERQSQALPRSVLFTLINQKE